MKYMMFFSITLFFVSNMCKAQIRENEMGNSEKSAIPKTDIKVNRQYDENGNLIKYDSTYSYSFSNFGNDSIMNDSIFRNLNNVFFFSDPPSFNNQFFQDSLFNNDFFRKDFFSTPFFDPEIMNKFFQEIDSINNSFIHYSIK